MAGVKTATAAYEQLCSDFPELSEELLDALRCELEEHLNAALKGDSERLSRLPLSPSLLGGLSYGATRRARDEPECVLPGLLASNAAPRFYAIIYALCVLRVCALLEVGEKDLAGALTCCDLRNVTKEDTAVPDNIEPLPDVVDPQPSFSSEEIWAAQLDSDDFPYEPLEAPAGFSPSNTGWCDVSKPVGESIAREEAYRRLAWLLKSLSHDPLSPLPPDSWLQLGMTSTLCRAISRLSSKEWMGSAFVDEAPLTVLLRDHLLHTPQSAAVDLKHILHALDEESRMPFLSALVGGGSPFCDSRYGASWEAVDKAIRDEVVPALQRIASSSNDDDGLIRTSLQLLSWYLNAPISRRPSVGSALIQSGVLQLVLQLALRRSIPPESNGAISQCWEWLLHACLRFSCVSRFVSQVPALAAAVQHRRPAHRTAWLVLLASHAAAPNKATGKTAMAQATGNQNAEPPLVQEAVDALETFLRELNTDAISPIIELLKLLLVTAEPHGSLGASMLFGSTTSGRYVTVFDDLRDRLQVAVSACDDAAGGSCLPDSTACVTSSSKQELDASEKRRDLLVRALSALKDLMGCLRAPGKKD